ncbi:non-canonical purine NTP pyrophosphatase [Alphaproteobacteria bacterium]|nr:non-canonical purine NTP pyrophosphatase [Alphaproteobacteria bacterium]GHT00609.1 non-canonical purine NTP pyrophosphatase [Alphaproteobacteria bacterium]
MEILIGTTNHKKIDDYLECGVLKGVSLRTLKEFSFEDVEENGKTLKENALLKARTYFEKSGIPTLADDTGFFIHALDGFPGLFSGRVAGPHKNFRKVKEEIAKKLSACLDTRATFSTAIAYVDAHNAIVEQADVEGTYAYGAMPCREDRTGYRDAFLPQNSEKMLSDLTFQEKKHFVPRFLALAKMWATLKKENIV